MALDRHALTVAQVIAHQCDLGELADVVHHLSDILHDRLKTEPPDDRSWLKRLLDHTAIEARAWPTWRQNAIKGSL